MITKPAGELLGLVIAKLRKELPIGLFYHAPEHTMDVFNVALKLSQLEKIGGEEANLIGVAALFHDSGYIVRHQNNEEIGCGIAREMLPAYGYSAGMIKHICEMIMATKIHQAPLDRSAQILCDADLDYLGRDDFFEISEKLYRELLFFELIKTEKEWHTLQINFFESHHYFTESEKNLRNEKKLEHLISIKNGK